MAQTYSQSLTGNNAGTRYDPDNVIVGDVDAAGNALNGNANFGFAQAGNMQRGNQILCKNLDGSQSWYTIDAERSVPGGELVMKPVGP
jgi:hypothetical protein